MSGTIFLAGILQFQSRALFEEALEALRTEETYSEQQSLIPIFQEAMVSETLLVLRHTSKLSGNFYDRLMSEAYLLSEFAGRGYIAGVLRDARPKVQVAMAAMSHPVIDPYKAQSDPEPAADYFPRLADTLLEYRYHSEGRDATVAWIARIRKFGKYDYLCFPALGSDDPLNDWWDGHYFLKSGAKWYSVTTDLDAQALSDPADEEIQLIMDGAAQPGQTFFSYVPGTESFRLYTHEGFEDAETPFGEFRRCMKVRVDLYFLPTDEDRYGGDDADRAFKRVTTTHYFGKGAGLVKLIFEDGELALTKMEAAPTAEVVAPPPAEENSATPNPRSNSERANNGGKPWWKFW
jgi:hypothetical protein